MNAEYQFPEVDRESFKPLYIQLSEMILEYAHAMQLQPGDLLPSENQLLAKLDVSRNSIRQAMDRLVKMDFVVKRRGQGAFVKEKKPCSLRQDLDLAFEESLRKQGLDVSNELIAKQRVQKLLAWTEGLPPISETPLLLVQRLKRSEGKIIVLEERLLPERGVVR